jgi:hypothetical protein
MTLIGSLLTGVSRVRAGALSGAGSLALSGTALLEVKKSNEKDLSGTGTLTLSGQGLLSAGAVQLSGSGTLTMSGTGLLSSSINLSGTGTLAMSGGGIIEVVGAGPVELTPLAIAQGSVPAGVSLGTIGGMRDSLYNDGTVTDIGQGSSTGWIRYDFGTSQTIGKVRVADGTIVGWGNVNQLNNREIQTSDDATNWTTQATITGGTNSSPFFLDFSFTPVSARYVRLWQAGSGNVGTTEFRVYTG